MRMAMDTNKTVGGFDLRIEHQQGYEFRVVFDKPTLAALDLDEPPPLGQDAGPDPARLLAAAIGSCLSASLTFCLSRAKIPLAGLSTDVHADLVRNERRRLRVGAIKVQLHPSLADGAQDIRGCLDTFEDFCVVTESVRNGVPVEVSVAFDSPPASTGRQAETHPT
jgi:uncharacterized OsmC-like protein